MLDPLATTLTGVSRRVESNQQGVHQRLAELIARHRDTPFRKPIAEFNRNAFEQASAWLEQVRCDMILDCGCGVGDSTRALAKRFPDLPVLGLDRSEQRLTTQRAPLPANARLIRTDLVDFWRLAAEANWQPQRQCIYYPNPYPKAAQVGHRFHAHPVFPFIIQLGGIIEVRSNWEVYLHEFAQALAAYGRNSSVSPVTPQPPISAFERKYRASGQPLWQLISEP